MNYALIAHLIGSVLLLIAAAMGVCLGGCMLGGMGGGNSLWALTMSLAITALTGALMYYIGRRHRKDPLLRREGIVITGIGWLVSSVFVALPYVFSDPGLNPARAFFESCSGLTTTGATVITDLTIWPEPILLWRAMTQWLGGMGVLVLFVAILSILGVGGKNLIKHETSAQLGTSIRSRVRDIAGRLWLIYLGVTVACACGLMLLGMTFLDAIMHALTTMATGGFSNRNASIAYYENPAIHVFITFFMLLAGISYMWYARILNSSWRTWKVDEEIRAYLILVSLAILVIGLDLSIHHVFLDDHGRVWRGAAFQVVSVMTSTGFVTEDFDKWPQLSKAILMLLMFCGGCAGSTAGGLKVMRLLLLVKIIRHQLIQTYRPNQVFNLRLDGRPVDEQTRLRALMLIGLYGLTMALGVLMVTFLEPDLSLDGAFSGVLTSVSNIGPGLAELGPTQNFALLSDPTLVLLALLMVIGRLEFFAILVLFLPSLWKRN